MPYLLTLAEQGFSVWPFDTPGRTTAIEIYPRALTGAVNKSSWKERHKYLSTHYADQSETLLERAAGSEDAFDAAVSALVMSKSSDELEALEQTRDPNYAIEGKIWRPNAPA